MSDRGKVCSTSHVPCRRASIFILVVEHCISMKEDFYEDAIFLKDKEMSFTQQELFFMVASFYTLTMNEPIIFFFYTQNHSVIPWLIITVVSLGGNSSHFSSKVSGAPRTAWDPGSSPKLESPFRRFGCEITHHKHPLPHLFPIPTASSQCTMWVMWVDRELHLC